MKVYLIKEADIQRLFLMVDRDPTHGPDGGSSQVLSKEEEAAYRAANGFYNYQVRTWADQVMQDTE